MIKNFNYYYCNYIGKIEKSKNWKKQTPKFYQPYNHLDPTKYIMFPQYRVQKELSNSTELDKRVNNMFSII